MCEKNAYLEQNTEETFQPQRSVTPTVTTQFTQNEEQALSPDVLQACELGLAIIIGLLAALICANAAVRHKKVRDEN